MTLHKGTLSLLTSPTGHCLNPLLAWRCRLKVQSEDSQRVKGQLEQRKGGGLSGGEVTTLYGTAGMQFITYRFS